MTQESKGSKDSFFVQPSLYVGPLEVNFSKIGGYIKNLLGPGERSPLRLSKMVRHLYFWLKRWPTTWIWKIVHFAWKLALRQNSFVWRCSTPFQVVPTILWCTSMYSKTISSKKKHFFRLSVLAYLFDLESSLNIKYKVWSYSAGWRSIIGPRVILNEFCSKKWVNKIFFINLATYLYLKTEK